MKLLRQISIIIFIFSFTALNLFQDDVDSEYIDAALDWGDGKTYLFKGNEYIRFDMSLERADSGYPKLINNNTWPGLSFSNIDAAVNMGIGKVYFFKNQQFIRYDIEQNRADPGYPRNISGYTWPGLTFIQIDAAFNNGDGKIYFFSGDQFISFDIDNNHADEGYPKEINSISWDDLSFTNINAALYFDNKVFFFNENIYTKYNLNRKTAYSGYPKSILDRWEGLVFSEQNTEQDENSQLTDSSNTGETDESIISQMLAGRPDGSELLSSLNIGMEKEVLEIVNRERTSRGLNPLAWDEDLAYSARYHAADMAMSDYFDHDSYDRDRNGFLVYVCGTFERIRAFTEGWAENISAGYSTPESVMEGWMNSTRHRENILNPSYTELGVGYYYYSNSTYGQYWVQNFR